MRDCRAVATQNRKVGENLWFLSLEIDGRFEVPKPGQFVQLRSGTSTDPLLRRPFSVASFENGAGPTLGIVYAAVGRWTRFIASQKPGFDVTVLGPLGSPYVTAGEELSVLVAGGRGVAPLLYLSKRLAETGQRSLSLVGARSKKDLFWGEDLAGPGKAKFITEDGSLGAKGMVTDFLEAELSGARGRATVYACGPLGMLKKVAEICSGTGTECQTSVETVFACGIGVCRGCMVPSGRDGGMHLMACSDGPVLRAADVDWGRFVE